MLDEERVRESVRQMRALIRVGRDPIARHSPMWAVFLAAGTFRVLGERLDELEHEAGGEPAGSGTRPYRKAGCSARNRCPGRQRFGRSPFQPESVDAREVSRSW